MGEFLLIGVFVGAVAIFSSLVEDENRQEWESKKREYYNILEKNNQELNYALENYNNKSKYYKLVSRHYKSCQSANLIYNFIKKADEANKVISKSINGLKRVIKEEFKNKPKNMSYKEEIKFYELINNTVEAKNKLIEEFKQNKAEIKQFYANLKEINKKTAKLKYKIRDKCGSVGEAWYERLEARLEWRN